ncbi:ribosomal protein S18-alanine N-acetyltransferase [Hujiaoplasma nucleasis]|uniref:[Ribosomal protein bS18]-alanine N-acetyltransferase n=1 Tax=Hujiaoplasma nucleasis TaxID=2725268 RepID=A0A7L6N5F1_9MOLU|nr:ribosomal protein S18-alanine N-acetyltransferase [Hujiaoplasma nucleasis]QLY40497.1 ribosomal protein S18-alanine N-acetyltransferase [Hujiaoplasma nucleasis]
MLKIREFQINDLSKIIELETHFYKINQNEFMESYIENPLIQVYVIERNTDWIGYMIIWLDQDKFQLYTIFIIEQYRHQGYAYQALKLLEEKIYNQGVYEYSLEVRPSNKNAIALYKKLGYSIQAIRKDYYPNHEDALLMYKNLRK